MQHFSDICTRVMALDLCQNFVSAQYLENKWTEFHQTLFMHHIDKIYVGIVFRTFVPMLWPLIYAKISFPSNILRTNGQNFTKFYKCIHIDKIYVGIVTHHFSHICTRVMAVDLSRNCVSFQYLHYNKRTEFHQTLYNY